MKKNILLITSCFAFTLSGINAYASVSGPADNQPVVVAEQVTITGGWARKSMAPNNNSAAYMKISNKTDKDLVIIGASAANVANNVELHNSFVDDKGVSRMTTLDKIVVPAKTDIELAPGGMHIMLFDLKKSLNVGDKFNIEVKIQDQATPVIVETEVK